MNGVTRRVYKNAYTVGTFARYKRIASRQFLLREGFFFARFFGFAFFAIAFVVFPG